MNEQTTPILLIWFNRPNHAQRVLNRLRVLQPTALYIAIDGPRVQHPTDRENVQLSLYLLNSIDWPCTIETLIHKQNLGCRQAVSSAIDWFFEHIEAGIILEDDCLPDLSFFSYCADLLIRYANNNRVMHISGANMIGRMRYPFSYCFTNVCHVWGWATWKRAWQLYDLTMKTYPENGSRIIRQHSYSIESERFFKYIFDESFEARVDTWDYQWLYTIWYANGLCILPTGNLIQNIGFGEQATHTKSISKYAELPLYHIGPLIHPPRIEESVDTTKWLHHELYRSFPRWKTWVFQIKNKFTSFLK